MIDDGIGIANDRFRDTAVTTRIRHFLDLSSPDAGGVVKATDELLAWSCTRGQIDDLLDQYKDCPDGEERIYRDLGLIDPAIDLRQPLRAAVSHGTHCSIRPPGMIGGLKEENCQVGRSSPFNCRPRSPRIVPTPGCRNR